MSDKASSCPGCGYPINKAEIETEQDRVNIRAKNKGKNFLTIGGILLLVTMVFVLSTANTEAVLRAKKLTKGLYGSKIFEWLLLRYAPTLLLWISIILVVIGMIFVIISKRKSSTKNAGLSTMDNPFLV